MRRIAVFAVVLGALGAPAPAAAAFERCCFRVEIEVSGPGWSWEARHLARYVDKGKIFIALTALRGRERAPVASFSIRGCAQVGRRPSPRTFASLEDSSTAGVDLVVRSAELARAARRCGVEIPSIHAVRPPWLALFRRAGCFSVVRRDGDARVVVRFRHVRPR